MRRCGYATTGDPEIREILGQIRGPRASPSQGTARNNRAASRAVVTSIPPWHGREGIRTQEVGDEHHALGSIPRHAEPARGDGPAAGAELHPPRHDGRQGTAGRRAAEPGDRRRRAGRRLRGQGLVARGAARGRPGHRAGRYRDHPGGDRGRGRAAAGELPAARAAPRGDAADRRPARPDRPRGGEG